MFLKHLEGCTPLNPCGVCQAVTFLQQKLGESEFKQLVAIFEGRTSESGDKDPFSVRVDTLEVSVRTANAFRNDKIYTIRQLLEKSEAELLRVPFLGRKSLNELKEVLAQKGWRIGQLATAA